MKDDSRGIKSNPKCEKESKRRKHGKESVGRMKSKKIVIILGGILVLAAAIFAAWWFKDFDAAGYTQAVLDQNFKGEVSAMKSFVEEKSEKELKQQYKAGIQSFVEKNITNGVEMDEALKEQYTVLCKKIFEAMKYKVKTAERVTHGKYKVPVEYQATDVFQKFTAAVPGESARLLEKVNKGEYKGTEEEINQQMKAEFLENCYQLLEQAFQEMQYGEKQTESFVIEQNSDGLYEMSDEQLKEFVTKIMGFDENQD